MTVFLKNTKTGITFDFNGVTESKLVNVLLQEPHYELVNKNSITSDECKYIIIPEIPMNLTDEERLLGDFSENNKKETKKKA